VRGYSDRFGNRVRHFDTQAPHEVMRTVRRALSYVPGSTTVKTTADEALASGQGGPALRGDLHSVDFHVIEV
jgi:hypothetical protein